MKIKVNIQEKFKEQMNIQVDIQEEIKFQVDTEAKKIGQNQDPSQSKLEVTNKVSRRSDTARENADPN